MVAAPVIAIVRTASRSPWKRVPAPAMLEGISIGPKSDIATSCGAGPSATVAWMSRLVSFARGGISQSAIRTAKTNIVELRIRRTNAPAAKDPRCSHISFPPREKASIPGLRREPVGISEARQGAGILADLEGRPASACDPLCRSAQDAGPRTARLCEGYGAPASLFVVIAAS